jgi:hypothetical protein
MINRAKMPRQLRDKGGIASVTPREKYGLGSKLKDRFRKLVPNELADIAVKAAPFVAPFSPGTAALMRGIGRFDQRGSISDAVKQGVGTFAFGKIAGKIPGTQDYFGRGMEGAKQLAGDVRQKAGSLFEAQAKDPKITPKDAGKVTKKGIKGAIETVLKDLPKGIRGQLIAGTATAGASLLASYFQGDFREQEPGETQEEYLARRREYVGTQMRTYMDSYFKTDPEYAALNDAGRDAFVARYNVRKGGMPVGIMRTNKAGVMERDYRDKGGFVPVGIKEKADDVPAMLSKNEFVFTADAVRGAGNGSIEKGAQRMYDTMKKLEKRVV